MRGLKTVEIPDYLLIHWAKCSKLFNFLYGSVYADMDIPDLYKLHTHHKLNLKAQHQQVSLVLLLTDQH